MNAHTDPTREASGAARTGTPHPPHPRQQEITSWIEEEVAGHDAVLTAPPSWTPIDDPESGSKGVLERWLVECGVRAASPRGADHLADQLNDCWVRSNDRRIEVQGNEPLTTVDFREAA